ncbi:hypothetical protein L3X38_024736 [Prunus dulcis]|uniref:Reverse transcriptase zinc-binding domain-containing protein n=1 Tax=Prunus dulcis TaxID=3755 RepID=A0AAD4W1G1_PRUDU|nr:hypothetical protein L3X38_024736 [Prunus dulcis]
MRRLSHSPICHLCSLFPEMVEHMLLLCPWTRAVWFCCPFGYSLDLASISTMDSWLTGFLSSTFVDGDKRDWGVSLFMFCSWEIWKARCKALFKDLRPSPQLVFSQAISCLEEFSQAKDLATCAPLLTVVLLLDCTGPLHRSLLSKSILMALRRPNGVWVVSEWLSGIILALSLVPLRNTVISRLRCSEKPIFLLSFITWKLSSPNVIGIGFVVKLTEPLMLPPS